MSEPIDRRTFLSRSAKSVAAAAFLTAGGGGLLAACGGGSNNNGGGSGGTPKAQGTPGVSTASPKPGGSLRFGVNSEIDGFDPAINHWDQTGITYARTVYDPLAILGPDGKVHPYLAKSIDHSPDYAQWTIGLRDGVTFHDGAALDAKTVVGNFELSIASPLAGPALAYVDSVTPSNDGKSVVVKMKGPWVPFDTYLTGNIGGQVAYMTSPNSLKAKDRSKNPVGTGPFVFKEWVPGDHFTATKNAKYWRSGVPYLDSITYKPIPDAQQLENSLKAGNLDVFYTASAQNFVDFEDNDKYTFLTSLGDPLGEPNNIFFMINTAVKPVDDVRVRKALALATDQAQVVKVAYQDVSSKTLPSTGPFPKGSPYYTETGYPTKPDPTAAKKLIDAYTAEKGKPSIKLGTTNNPANLATVQLLKSQWEAVGVAVQIEQVEQAQYITNALTGNYTVYAWIQFAAADPDANFIWWSPLTAAPVGQLSLNFARNKDQQIGDALLLGRTSTDPAKRAAAYQAISKQFAQDYPYIWITQSFGSIVANPVVQNFANPTSPEGAPGAGFFSAAVYPTQIWLDR